MRDWFQLDPDEVRVLADAVARACAGIPRPSSFEGYLQSWSGVVCRVEQGYKLTIDDYTNDLYVRDIIESVLLGVPATLHKKVFPEVEVLDRRFIAATRGVSRPLLEPDPQTDRLGYWWFRIPKQLNERLERSLKTWGILDA